MANDSISLNQALIGFKTTAAADGYDLQALWFAELRPAETRLAAMLTSIETMSVGERQRVRETVDYALTCMLGGFSTRMASGAVQEMHERLLLPSAIALTLDNGLADPRDVYVSLAIICDASERVGTNADEIIRRVSKCALPERAALMEGYLGGPSYVRSIKSMGIELVDTPAGPQYVGI